MPRGARGHRRWALVERLALALPGVVAANSYGTPAFRIGGVGGKLMARRHQTEDALVLRVSLLHREILMETAPDVFYLIDHYANWPWVLVNLSTVTREQLARVLKEAWHEVSGENRSRARSKKPRARPARRR